jgi:hypothetical protein
MEGKCLNNKKEDDLLTKIRVEQSGSVLLKGQNMCPWLLCNVRQLKTFFLNEISISMLNL